MFPFAFALAVFGNPEGIVSSNYEGNLNLLRTDIVTVLTFVQKPRLDYLLEIRVLLIACRFKFPSNSLSFFYPPKSEVLFFWKISQCYHWCGTDTGVVRVLLWLLLYFEYVESAEVSKECYTMTCNRDQRWSPTRVMYLANFSKWGQFWCSLGFWWSGSDQKRNLFSQNLIQNHHKLLCKT